MRERVMITFWMTYKVVLMCRNSWSPPWSISLLTIDIIIKSFDGQDMGRVTYKGEERKNTVELLILKVPYFVTLKFPLFHLLSELKTNAFYIQASLNSSCTSNNNLVD